MDGQSAEMLQQIFAVKGIHTIRLAPNSPSVSQCGVMREKEVLY